MSGKPVLWHIPVSHYNEKVRWALAWKGIEHARRAPVPGAHMVVAAALTRGRCRTFPVLQIGGQAIGDSTAIIAELERRFPEPPLYPADPDQRRRALELEDWFDEQLGAQIRLFAWHEAIEDPDAMQRFAEPLVPRPLRRFATPVSGLFLNLRFGAKDAEAAENARGKVLAALDRLEGELEASGGDYLVGDSFTVADLTAAALFYPLVTPPEGPRLPESGAEGFEDFRAPLKERAGYRWVEEMFRRHRKPAPVAAGA
jgi:glutathione S-transferase